MKIRKINPDIINKSLLYEYFLNPSLYSEEDIFLEDYYEIEKAPYFPIYLAIKNDETRSKEYIKSFSCIRDHYLNIGKETLLDKFFWYSLFIEKFAEKIKENYPQVLEDEKKFRNIVIKKFDWENYIYKLVLGASYVTEHLSQEHHEKYFTLISNNLDVYNYTLKSEIFRNSNFLLNLLNTIEETNMSDIAKKRIDLGNKKDERVGRRVISEFSKSYPVVFIHMLEPKEFKEYFLKYVEIYNI